MLRPEERSFAPEGTEKVNLDPIRNPAKASNAVIARGINRFHECLEAHVTKTQTNFETLQGDIQRLRNELVPKGHKPIAFLSSWQAGWRGATTVFAGLSFFVVIWRGIIALWPYIEEFGRHLINLISTGHP